MRKDIGLFKAKRADNNQWIEGSLIVDYPVCKNGVDEDVTQYFILDLKTSDEHVKPVPVIPETIGEYSGLTDKNKKRIFENHIVKAVHQPYLDGSYAIGVVTFSGGAFKLSVHQSKNRQEYKKYTDNNVKEYPIEHNFIERNYVLEVIGNIHDNPEILKGGVDNDC